MKTAGIILLCAALSLVLCSCGDEAETSSNATGQLHMVHEYESEIISEPSCEETGIIKYTCICGSTYEESVDASGHDFVEYEVVSPTYSSEGYTVYKCTRCGATENRDPTPKLSSIELPDVPISK